MNKIEHIVTHTRPHLDEAAGVAVLRLFRPELVSPEVEYTFMGIGRLGPQSQKEQEDESVLYLGVLGGNADEHLPGREKMSAPRLWSPSATASSKILRCRWPSVLSCEWTVQEPTPTRSARL